MALTLAIIRGDNRLKHQSCGCRYRYSLAEGLPRSKSDEVLDLGAGNVVP
jgi:hypothetical protein